MRISTHLIICCSALIALMAAACSGTTGRVVAEVNGTPIYDTDVTKAMAQERDKYDALATKTPAIAKQLARSALELLIQQQLLLDEARRLKIDIKPEALNRELAGHFSTDDISEIKDILKEAGIDPDFWLELQRNKLTISALVDQEVIQKIPVTNQEIQAYYKKNTSEFKLPKQYRARQILTDSRERADDIAKRLEKGEDFAELARNYSTSPDSARGGDLGFFSTKEFPPIFSEICAQLKLGETSDVKKTEYGYQIFQLLETRKPRTLTIDEVRPQIIDRLRAEHSAEAFTTWFKEIRTRGRILINEDALEEVDLHAQTTNK